MCIRDRSGGNGSGPQSWSEHRTHTCVLIRSKHGPGLMGSHTRHRTLSPSSSSYAPSPGLCGLVNPGNNKRSSWPRKAKGLGNRHMGHVVGSTAECSWVGRGPEDPQSQSCFLQGPGGSSQLTIGLVKKGFSSLLPTLPRPWQPQKLQVAG